MSYISTTHWLLGMGLFPNCGDGKHGIGWKREVQ